ncbi:MAG: phosphotransferase [Pseudomonadota bacterium]
MTAPLAPALLAAWEIEDPPCLLAARENAVYKVRLPGGTRAALRLHRKGYRPPKAIAAELAWTAHLAADGVACPVGVKTRQGHWLATAPDGRAASVVTWADGTPIAPEPARFAALGQVLARFHEAADGLVGDGGLPQLDTLPRWGADAILGEAPRWGRFWENPALKPSEAAHLRDLRRRLADMLDARETLDTGFIHADMLPDNVLDDGQTLTLIDFDDCGLGPRAYDLATALIAHVEAPAYADLAGALLESYQSARGTRPGLAEEVSLCLLLRALASCGWAATRTQTGDQRQRAYAERALRLAGAWREGAPLAAY